MKGQDKGFDSDYYQKKHQKREAEDLEGKRLHDLYRHTTKLIE